MRTVLGKALVAGACASVLAVVVWRQNNARCNELFRIARSGATDNVQQFMSRCDINAADQWGWTPLFYAAIYGNFQAATILLAAGADASVRDRKGLSVVDYVDMRLRTNVEGDTTSDYLRDQGIVLPGPDDQSRVEVSRDELTRIRQLLVGL